MECVCMSVLKGFLDVILLLLRSSSNDKGMEIYQEKSSTCISLSICIYICFDEDEDEDEDEMMFLLYCIT